MIKKALYPKTKRVSTVRKPIVVTEKLDGSNLCFFKKNGELYIAQRNNIFTLAELGDETLSKNVLYKGLKAWLVQFADELKTNLLENAVICGEWISMGKLKYSELTHTFNMFAKANIDDKFDLYNIYYDMDLFIYPFENQTKPDFINIVPVAFLSENVPVIQELDTQYELYCSKVSRNVEGFVINNNNSITKYVRMKNGKLSPHTEVG